MKTIKPETNMSEFPNSSTLQPACNRLATDCIDRQAAIDALWKALYDYEDKAEKQFQESDELDVRDWIVHRIFVQNMSDIDRKVIQDLPSVQPEHKTGHWLMNGKRYGVQYYRCSECEEEEEGFNCTGMKYCPNCGARMEVTE